MGWKHALLGVKHARVVAFFLMYFNMHFYSVLILSCLMNFLVEKMAKTCL